MRLPTVRGFKKIKLKSMRPHRRGLHGTYIILSKGVGLKLLHDDCYLDYYEVLELVDEVKKEFECLKTAYKRCPKSVPKPMSLTVVEFSDGWDGLGFFGIGYTMQHIDGVTLATSKYRKKQKEDTINKLFVALASRGIYHGDLHSRNVLIRNNKPIALDFDPEYVTFKYVAAKYW